MGRVEFCAGWPAAPRPPGRPVRRWQSARHFVTAASTAGTWTDGRAPARACHAALHNLRSAHRGCRFLPCTRDARTPTRS